MHDAFLQTLGETPRDDVSRLVYADWLTEQDDPIARLQAEYLRLTVRSEPTARLQELAAQLDPAWLAVVSRLPIENCGRERPAEIAFEFRCDRDWRDLTPTADATVRHCDGCRKDVHYCATIREARHHARAGHCIALDLGVIRHEGDVPRPNPLLEGVMGMMIPDWEAEAAALTLDPVSAEREQRRMDRERPESDFELAWEEDDLREIGRRDEWWHLQPFNELALGTSWGMTRFYDAEGDWAMTCRWGRGVRVAVAGRSRFRNTATGWYSWVPGWLLPRPLRTWPNVEATLVDAPPHVWDTAYLAERFDAPIDFTHLGGPTWYHQMRSRERLDLVVWRSYLPPPSPGVLRCLDAYHRLERIAWWCAWLWGGRLPSPQEANHGTT